MNQSKVSYLILTLAILLTTLPALSTNAAVTTSPTFELDASNINSFNPSSTGTVYDLASNRAISGTNSGVSFSNVNGGIFDTFTATSKTGIYFAPSAVGTGTNPSGSMSLETWIKFTSFNNPWNIFATRWFTDTAGAGVPSDFHFAVKYDVSTYKLNLYTSSTENIFGSKDLDLNTWYLLGFTLDNTARELRFYINGQIDGTVKTNVSRTANTSNYLFVGDPRTGCSTCSFNGQMARFRMWNSVLSSAQMLSNFRSEGAGFGYSTTTSLAAATFPNPNYRASNQITATVSKPGKVTFYQQGVVIPGCKNKTATSTVTCNWKPSRRGKIAVTASLTPTDLGFVPSTGAINFSVLNRSGSRT